MPFRIASSPTSPARAGTTGASTSTTTTALHPITVFMGNSCEGCRVPSSGGLLLCPERHHQGGGEVGEVELERLGLRQRHAGAGRREAGDILEEAADAHAVEEEVDARCRDLRGSGLVEP